MLCVGGSAIPFGWSFLSIAKVPMSWQPTDLWVVEVELPAGTRVEYKYVILEEQDWTRQVNEAVEGRVEYTYRVAPDDTPPDVQSITKQMAIVAWQSGPNRILQVPSESEIESLLAGSPKAIDRPLNSQGRVYGQQALGRERGKNENRPFSAFLSFSPSGSFEENDKMGESGVWERLTVDDNGKPFLDRRDGWGRGESAYR